MAQGPDVTQALAAMAVAARWQDLPPSVAHAAKRSLINIVAAALAGCHDPTIETMLATLARFSGGRQAALIGRRERLDALGAAFLNAAGANVLDFCDTHTPTAIHPTAPLVPALLALGALRPVSGRDFLLALVVGHEVECRIGLAVSPSHYNRGWHITATCGVFGAAAGCGKLLGLDTTRMVWALGIAATQAAGLCECLGTPAKSVGVGNAARNGLTAALLAADNFAGPAEPLAGVQGYFHALNEQADLARITDRLGQSWEIPDTSYKPYPCGFVIHPALDCVLDWRRENPTAAVDRVIVTGNPLMAARADRPNIATGRESQVSVQHAVAVALVSGEAGPTEFSDGWVNEPAITALRRKIEVRRDPDCPTIAATVEIVTMDGTTHRLATKAARGSASNPMSDADLTEKLRACAAGWNPRHDIAPLIEAIWQLDKCDDIAKLAALTTP